MSAQPHRKGDRGFIALMSAIVISAILVILIYTVSGTSYYARLDALGGDFKRVALGLAESCNNVALLSLAHSDDPTAYNPVSTVFTVGQDGQGRDVKCTLDKIDGANSTNRTILSRASYVGTFSNVQTSVTVRDPDVREPLPACSLITSTPSVPAGKQFDLLWGVSANGASFTIDQGVGSVIPVVSGSTTRTASTSPGVFTYTGIAKNSSGNSGPSCQATISVTTPPPTPSCADVVMMLDRSGSMFDNSAWIPDEKTAANELLNQYLDPKWNLNPLPFVGVGRFGDAGGTSADIIGQLTNVAGYPSLFSAISTGLSNNGSWTNLKDAINVGNGELNSSRHVKDAKGKYPKKVLILVSDGEPNQPFFGNPTQDAINAANTAKTSISFTDHATTTIFTIHFGDTAGRDFLAGLASDNSVNGTVTPTGFLSPSTTASPNEWTSPMNATSSDGVYATSLNDNDDQGYRSFNFPAIPAGAIIQGIEVKAKAFSSVTTSPLWSGTDSSFGTGGDANDISGWDEEGSDSDSTTLARAAQGSGEDTASPDGSRFAKIDAGEWICHSVNAAGYSNLKMTYYWRGDGDAEDGESATVQYRSGGACTSTTGWNTVATHELDDGENNAMEAWSTLQSVDLPDGLSGFVRFRNEANGAGSESLRIDGAILAGTSPATGCQLQVRVGDSGNFSSYQTKPLTSTDDFLPVFGGANDDWDSVTWTNGDFTNGNFRLEVRNNDPGAACDDNATTYLDTVQVNVHYKVIDPAAENLDDDDFFISPQSTDMEGIFKTIGKKVCPALAPACSNSADDDGDGTVDKNDTSCHSDGDVSNAASYTPDKGDEWTSNVYLPAPPSPPPSITPGSWEEIKITP